MDTPPMAGHLSALSTSWARIEKAHTGAPDEARAAQEQLFSRYRGAIYRYLLKAVGDSHLADDLTQEFGLKLVRGDFKHLDRARGKFRAYLKTVLFHLVSKARSRPAPQQLPANAMSAELVPAAAAQVAQVSPAGFDEHWRDELLSRAWERLRVARPMDYAVLRFKVDQPKMPSAVIALSLAREFGKAMTGHAVRQKLHRARALFVQYLREEVARSLATPAEEAVDEELRELGLWEWLL